MTRALLSVEVPDGLLIALVAAGFPLIAGLLAWIVRELSRITVTNARLEERQEAYEGRLESHHSWTEQLDARLRAVEKNGARA